MSEPRIPRSLDVGVCQFENVGSIPTLSVNNWINGEMVYTIV